MKRDMELVRKLLMAVESLGEEKQGGITFPGNNYGVVEDIDGYHRDTVYYHIKLMIDAGLISGNVSETMGGGVSHAFASSLTWEGHEFLDAARENSVWQKTMEKAGNAATSISFEVLKALLIKTAGESLGL